MANRLAFIHTVTSLPLVFKDLCRELIPNVDLFHVVDESLLQNTIRSNSLTRLTARRLLGYLVSAQEAGAQAVMVTCSSMGQAVEWSRCFVDIPVYRVDEPMADLAVETGHRIGVAATLQTTLNPTAELIRARAASRGKEVQVTTRLCEGAFEAVMAGDTARHDALVTAGLRDLLSTSDVIVLAQASMARVADSLPAEVRQIPILSSPRLAVEFLASVLA
jgi:Asp/Glu/hydantoin racemase